MSEPAPDASDPFIQWSPVPRSKTHELVIDAIEEQIMAGRLKVGDSIPPERELASRLEVSRTSVREAIRVLESQGVVEARVGSGRGAGTTITAMPSEALTRLLRMHLGLSNFRVEDVIEVRIALERVSVALVAQDPTEERLAAIRVPLERMDNDDAPLAEFNDADTEFHTTIAQVANNRLVADLTTAIRSSLRSVILEAFRREDESSTLRQTLQQQHHQIFDAIANKNVDGAANLTEEHIRYAYGALSKMRGPLA